MLNYVPDDQKTVYEPYFDPASRLWIVGNKTFEDYIKAYDYKKASSLKDNEPTSLTEE